MIRAAVIGCGRMGAFTSAGVRAHAPACWFPLAHAEAIAAEPRLELAALCDASPEQLAKAQAEYGVANGYTDPAALAGEVRPRLAGIATRTPGRAAIVETLHAHGTRAFHIEKPLCNSVAELDRLTPLLTAPDTFATYGAVRRFFAIYREAVRMARSGDFGPLLEVRCNFGPGALYWAHPHCVDLILLAANGAAVAGVQARLGPLERDGATVDNDPLVEAATIWFEGGLAGHIGRAPGLDLELACADAVIAVRADGHSLDLASASGGSPYFSRADIAVAARGPQGALAPVTELADCLDGDSRAQTANARNVADILTGQRISFAMVQSHLEGSRIVGLDAIDPAMAVMARTGGNPA